MKNLQYLKLFVMFGVLSFAFSSCLKDECELTHTYYFYVPVYKQLDEIRLDIRTEGPREMKQTGKIYYYSGYLFINEYREGVHVIDNRDPENPESISFIKIPGNVDMAVRNGILYADNYIDLVAINITNPESPEYLGRSEEVFNAYSLHEDLGYLVYYEQTEETQELTCDDQFFGNDRFFRGGGMWLNSTAEVDFSSPAASNDQSNSGGAGVGGSMARFTISSGYLYSVDESSLRVFDLEIPEQAELINTVHVGWGIETIFPYEDKLFIGSSNGMFIFDNSNPTSPTQLSAFAHASSCDPVYVAGDIAYVTLRSGNACQGFTDQLDVIDVSTLTDPKLLKSYPMHNPHGLSVSDNNLFICEGDQGLKVFDAEDWETIDKNLLDHVTGFTTFDIITLGPINLAMVIAEDGMYQFDYSDPSDMKLLSIMHVSR